MKANVVTRLDKLNRRVPPAWADLARLMGPAGERLNQSELDALLAVARGRATPEQAALNDAWEERNKWRIWAVWDEKYPGWGDAPFWAEWGANDDDGAANEDEW